MATTGIETAFGGTHPPLMLESTAVILYPCLRCKEPPTRDNGCRLGIPPAGSGGTRVLE